MKTKYCIVYNEERTKQHLFQIIDEPFEYIKFRPSEIFEEPFSFTKNQIYKEIISIATKHDFIQSKKK
jgi:hypothetical protein